MKSMYVNGKLTVGRSADGIEVKDPATGETIDSVPRGTADDIKDAVSAPRQGFSAWRSCVANDRAAMLHEVAARMRAHQEELIELLTREQGKP